MNKHILLISLMPAFLVGMSNQPDTDPRAVPMYKQAANLAWSRVKNNAVAITTGLIGGIWAAHEAQVPGVEYELPERTAEYAFRANTAIANEALTRLNMPNIPEAGQRHHELLMTRMEDIKEYGTKISVLVPADPLTKVAIVAGTTCSLYAAKEAVCWGIDVKDAYKAQKEYFSNKK